MQSMGSPIPNSDLLETHWESLPRFADGFQGIPIPNSDLLETVQTLPIFIAPVWEGDSDP
jgi:hypothetical protein